MGSGMGWVGTEWAAKGTCHAGVQMTLDSVGALSGPHGCSWVLKAAERGSSRRCCPGAAPRRMFSVYPLPSPAFGRGRRGYICQSAEVPTGESGDLRQRAVSPTDRRRAPHRCAEGVSRSWPHGLLLRDTLGGSGWLSSRAGAGLTVELLFL